MCLGNSTIITNICDPCYAMDNLRIAASSYTTVPEVTECVLGCIDLFYYQNLLDQYYSG